MGQFRATKCPICGSTENGKWTCPPCTQEVDIHRNLVRNLQAWHSLYEAREVDEILIAADGNSYCLWDLDSFYAGRTSLPAQMCTAIELCLYQNIFEREAAVLMGVSASNPVSIYATIGLTRLIGQAYQGELPGYRLSRESAA